MTDITERLRRIYVAEGTNYVQEAADLIDKLRAERDALVNDVHSCHNNCTRAGCVNRRLRDALESIVMASVALGHSAPHNFLSAMDAHAKAMLQASAALEQTK